MTIDKSNIMGIDWGTKFIGLAYTNNDSQVIFPLGYIINDQMLYFSLADIFSKHNIKEIVIGWPTKQKNIQKKIDNFISTLGAILPIENIIIHKQEEDYSSVESGDIISHTAQGLGLGKNAYRKNAAQDTISAMVILERWKNKKRLENEN